MAKNTSTLNKFLTGSVTAAMVATAIVPVASANTNTADGFTYSDVAANNDHYENIMKARTYELMTGNTNGTFEPAKQLTRSNVVKALGKYVIAQSGGKIEDYDVSGVEPFADTPSTIADKELYNYSLIVKKAGIFSGSNNNLEAAKLINRQQMAKVLVNAFGLKDLAGKESKVTDNDKAFAEFVPFINILSENEVTAVTEFMPLTNTSRAQFASFLVRAYEIANPIEEVAPEVVSVSATNAKSLTVTFKGAVSDTSKVTFDVKRGETTKTTVSGLEASWNAEKTEATLSSDVNLAAGTYTVTAAGLDFAEGKDTATVKVDAQRVENLEIVSSDLIKNAAGNSATFTYKVVDQYGTDITKTVPNSAFNVSAVIGSSTPSVSLDPAKGVGTVSHTFATTDKTAVVTLVHKATGKAKTATLNVAAAATVESLTFGDNVLPANKTRIETGLASAVKSPATAKDQYGNTIKDLNTLNGALTLVSSNSGATFSWELDEDNNSFIVMDTTGLTANTTVVLTAVNPTSGKVFTKSFEVVKSAAPDKIELGELSVATVAKGDTGIVLPFKVYDQFGVELTPAQIVANKLAIEAWVTGDDSDYVSNFTIEADKNSANYGKFTFNALDKGTAALVINTPAGISTKLIEVKDPRVVTTVSKTDAVTLLQGATTELEFVFKDQYGEVIDNAVVTDNTDLSYEIAVTRISGDADGIVINAPALIGTDEELLAALEVNAATNKTGSYRVAVTLLDAGVAVSSANTIVSVAKNNASGLVYSVADVAVLNGSSDNTGTIDSTNVYAQKLVLSAKDANGQTFVINKADVVNVVSSNTDAVEVNKAGQDWFVAANDVTGITGEQTSTLTFTVNTLDGLKTLTKEVTVSKVAPEIQEVKVITTALTAPTKNIAGKVEKSVFEFSDKADALTGEGIFVIGKDQYGVWDANTSATAFVNSTNLAPSSSFAYDGTDLTLVAGSKYNVATGQDIKVSLKDDNGTAQITVKIIAADSISLVPTVGTLDEEVTVSTNYGFALGNEVSAVDVKVDGTAKASFGGANVYFATNANGTGAVTFNAALTTLTATSNLGVVTVAGTVGAGAFTQNNLFLVVEDATNPAIKKTIAVDLVSDGTDLTVILGQ